MKSLKSKVTLVYISLVVTIAIVGIASAISIYTLSRSINGLMTDNYKSINAVNNMIESVDKQNISVLNYIYSGSQDEIDRFYKENDKFYKWYSIEDNNITEKGEREAADKIWQSYNKYRKSFSKLEENKNSLGASGAIEFYNTQILSLSEELKKDLRDLSVINEQSMFDSKNRVIMDSRQSAYLIVIISSVLVICGFIISKTLINKFLKPIYVLTETVKSIKEENLNKQVPVISQDEIGDLAKEFNKMTKRLLIYEQSSKGELLNEKNKSLAIVKSISDPLIVLDTNYKIVLLNESCEKFFDVNEDKALNKHFLEAIRNGDLYDYISQTLSDKMESNSKIMKFNLKDKEYYFNILITIVRDTRDKNIGAVVLFQNVTKLKQLEKIKTNFISTISHEFKTPLTSIMIGASLLIDEEIGALNDRQRKVIDTIKEDGENLTQLVNNLLQLSKVESDKSIFNIKSASIEGVIQNSMTLFYELAEDKDVNLNYELSEDLPRVEMDSEKISWVVNNLISNALKFTNAGDDIEVTAYADKDKMYVSVVDTGIGIPEAYVEKVFDKFFQLHEGNFQGNGSGLGLPIAKEIVEAHGGNIWCESKLDVGSKFTFFLPLKDS